MLLRRMPASVSKAAAGTRNRMGWPDAPFPQGEDRMIDSVAFGQMVIDGRRYTSDLIIFPDGRVADGWRRRKGHRLDAADLTGLLASEPEVIVAGTGISGQMVPEPSLIDRMAVKQIRFIAEPNAAAVDVFNNLFAGRRVGGCFHLTC